MWRLQLQKLHNYLSDIKTLLVLSISFHISLCVLLFFVQLQKHITFNTNTALLHNNAIIKLLPFGQKKPITLQHKNSGASTSKNTTLNKTSLRSIDTKTGLTKASINKKTTVAKKKLSKKAQQKTLLKKEASLKKNTPLVKEKTKAIKKTPEKKETISQPTKPLDPSTTTQAQTQASAPLAAPQETPQEIVYVTTTELESIELQQAIFQALQEAWQPPTGVKNDISCKALIYVHWQGFIESYKLIEPSGVLIYDASVEEGIKSFKPPRMVWGKEIEVVFKPWSIIA